MSTIWFCSDYHFQHGRFKEDGTRTGALNFRQQYSSVEEMDEDIIRIHNSYVKKNDTVYHLGDFIWKGKPQPILERLNGYFYLVRGNHDRKVDFTLKHKVMHVVDGYYNIHIDKQDITLCHFPMFTWNKSHWNAWHLYGHHHRELPSQYADVGKKINVNVDVIHRPISFDEVKEIMCTRPDNWDLIKRQM